MDPTEDVVPGGGDEPSEADMPGGAGDSDDSEPAADPGPDAPGTGS